MNHWSVPKLWPKMTVAVLASGEGMASEMAQAVHQAGIPAIAVNSTFRMAPWAEMLYAADLDWWAHPKNRDAHEFAGMKVSCQPVKGVLRLRNSGREGFDPDPSAVRTGGNSGFQALHVAVHAGAARILLCGFNMSGGHWHGDHPQGLRETTPDTYANWRDRFGKLAPVLAERGVDVVNVTPGSYLTCFRRSSLESELAACSEPATA